MMMGSPPAFAARRAVVAVFFAQGFLFASWTAHIPHVKAHLGLGNGSLGLVLLGAPIGSILAMILASRLIPRLGSRTMVRGALVGYCVAGPLIGLGDSVALFFVAFLLWGLFLGSLDVSMNAQAITLESRVQRTLMPGFHGSWSLGSLMGSGAGVLGVGLGWSLSTQLLIYAIPVLVVVGWFTTKMIPDHQVRIRGPVARRTSVWRRAVVGLGIIVFLDSLCEGAVADWTAVYLRDSLHTTSVIAGLGFTAFLLTMMITRFAGNHVTTRFGAHRVVPVFALVATAGSALGLWIDHPWSVLGGSMCLGVGLALTVPMAFSACGHIPGVHAGRAVAAVSGIGYTAFVLGPALIGGLAALSSLRTALFLVPVLLAGIAITTFTSSALRAGPSGETHSPLETL
ncbi:MAG TPA: MFS transporter [Acidimicrobiales bacterium]|nr:MFS transporter [Acidimicrobiales bacterium]